MFGNRKEYDDDSYRSDFFLGEMEQKSTSRESERKEKSEKQEKKAENKAPTPQKPSDEAPSLPPKEKKDRLKKAKAALTEAKKELQEAVKAFLQKIEEAKKKKALAEAKKKGAEQKAPEAEKKPEGQEGHGEKAPVPRVKRPMRARRDIAHTPPKKETPAQEKDPALPNKESEILKSLDGMYGVYTDPEKAPKRALTGADYARYGVLFVCIFGFLLAGWFVFGKLFEYYRSYVIYSGLQEMVSEKDRFAEEYLKKAQLSQKVLTPADILAGKTGEETEISGTFSEEQETLVNKIAQLKKINPDTAGWITIDGTVVNYPVVWSATKNYYLRRDFYGKKLSSGTIYIDERNSPNLTENRNTVIYGHNMTDGSMFASIHDFASSTMFYKTTIQIATSEGVFIYTPFSVHESNAFDNYFETDFVSDEDFLDFCQQMAFISIFQTNAQFTKDSQIITLSTCMDNQSESEQRFAVHAVLTKVIR